MKHDTLFLNLVGFFAAGFIVGVLVGYVQFEYRYWAYPVLALVIGLLIYGWAHSVIKSAAKGLTL